MEKVWSATETCRFRIVDKESYNLDFKEIGKEPEIVTGSFGKKTSQNHDLISI